MPEDFIHTTFTTNPLAMFASQPVGVTFEDQEEDEKIVLLLRAHVVTLVPAATIMVILLVLPFFVPAILAFLQIDIFNIVSAGQLFLMTVFWYLLTFGYAFYKFIFWYFNVYLLTNERIVDFDFRGILHKEISFASFNKIQDVSPKIAGFFGTFFNYGNVLIQTAAERQEFEFERVSRPTDVVRAILEQMRKEEAEAPGEIA